MSRFHDVVVLTGAGVSAESGLGTFRDPDGIWAKFDPYKLATPEGFAEDPETVHAFYNARRRQLLTASANAAHAALAGWEQAVLDRGGRFLLVTQNIDDLHERAGTRTLRHMHGELLRARCGACGNVTDMRGDLSVLDVCGACGRVGAIRPHVVWFGEIPLHMDEILAALARCDLFVAIGTSGSVYPAAGFAQEARLSGARCVELNVEPSDISAVFDARRYGPATEIVPAWIAEHG